MAHLPYDVQVGMLEPQRVCVSMSVFACARVWTYVGVRIRTRACGYLCHISFSCVLLSIYQSMRESMRPSVYPSVCPSAYLSECILAGGFVSARAFPSNAHFLLCHQEEPLFIIYTINRFVTYEGSSIVDNFKNLLRESNVDVCDSDDDEPVTSSRSPGHGQNKKNSLNI